MSRSMKITWEIDVEADSVPEGIARAINLMPRKRPDAWTTVFKVEDVQPGEPNTTGVQQWDVDEFTDEELKIYLKHLE